MAYEALDTLQQTLDHILKHGDDLIIRHVKQELVSIHLQAVVLQMNLKNFPDKESIREIANTTNEIIEYFFSAEYLLEPGWIRANDRLSYKLRELARKLELTAGDVVDYIKSNGSVNNLRRRLSVALDASSSSRPALTRKDRTVGIDEDLEVISDRLVEGSSKLQVLPIVGTGGIGKTTLAKLVCSNKLVMACFDVLGWVTLSQDYSVGSVILNLLASMKGISADRDAERDIPMDSLIRRYLWGKKYLIVIDDMWLKKAWDDVKMLFPDQRKGSRIIVTTRLQEVAGYVASSSYIHVMRFLNDYDSWRLLLWVCEGCPTELEDIGKKIAKKCGGLPLSIVVAAGLLSKIHKTRYLWKQIAANDVQLETIIRLSYTHLPDYSRACFLYMAAFPEDYEIHVSELTKLWVAEGFIKCENGCKSLEEEAEGCLEDLVERNLVLVRSRKFDGKIKSCSLHDIVRDFCVIQSQREKLLLSVVDYLPSPILRRHFLPLLLKNHHRISATWYDLDLKDSMHSSQACSIICIPQKGYRSVGSIEKFSSLKILHVLRRNDYLEWEAGQVFDLLYLSYLASNIPTSIVPPSISKLQNLQTLIIYRSEVHLPVEIWRLRQLKHLIAFSFDALPHPEVEALPLENLDTLLLATDLCSERTVEMIPNIKKLGIRYSKEKFDAGYRLNNLKHLHQIETLKLKMLGCSTLWPSMNPVFPASLKKLTLSGWRFPWRFMTIAGKLPNLQALKLRSYACDGEHWETTEGEFVNLRLLLIDESNLQHWTTQSSHFPRLECLILNHCWRLSEIPISFGDIRTLKAIEVSKANTFLAYSARRIQLKQLESGDKEQRFIDSAISDLLIQIPVASHVFQVRNFKI